MVATFGANGDGCYSDGRGTWIGRQYHIGQVHKQLVKGEMVEMQDVMYVPDLRTNLFSITRAMSEGAKVTNDGDIIVVDWGHKQLRFDFKMKTQNGFYHGCSYSAYW